MVLNQDGLLAIGNMREILKKVFDGDDIYDVASFRSHWLGCRLHQAAIPSFEVVWVDWGTL